MESFVQEGDIHVALRQIRFSGAPERSLNSPIIQGIIAFDCQNRSSPLERAGAYYLLHQIFDNRRVQTQISSQRDRNKKLANKSLAKSKELFLSSGGEDFESQMSLWREGFLSESVEERVHTNRLTGLSMNQQWDEFERVYESFETKFISESILLAKAASYKKTVGTVRDFLSYSDSKYYAEGRIQMGDCLATRAQCDLSREAMFLDQAQDMYRAALMECGDIRGYDRYLAIGGEPDEDMRQKMQQLKVLFDELNEVLVAIAS